MSVFDVCGHRCRPHALAWAAAVCLSGLLAPAHAQLNLMRQPANARVTEPAPNIMLSLDDSGSMGWDLEGCSTLDWRVDVYGDYNEAGAVNCPGRSVNTRPSRMRILREALIDTFGNPSTGAKGIIDDNRIRLAWQSMWDNGRLNRPGHLQNMQDSIVAGQANAIQPFSGAHRQNFHAFVTSLSPVYGTPSHKMMSNVRNYMFSGLSVNSPFASRPGTTAQPYLECRRSYHIFMTDGAWNTEAGGLGNFDGSNFSLPDGTVFAATDQTRLYRDGWGGTIGTLADWAMANWATDFQTGIPNQIKPIVGRPGDELIGTTTLREYWNPKNNPMTWQGVTQYAIGFGTSATRWSGRPSWGTDTHTGADYVNLVNGNVGWSDVFGGGEAARPMDLWHMALNGRGKYYQARSASDLRVAFNDILQTILVDTSSPLAAASGSSIKVGLGGQAYLSAYDGTRWSGEFRALRVSPQGSVTGTDWDAAKLLDQRDLGAAPRRILTHNGSGATTFDWSQLNTTQQSALRGSDSDATAQLRLAYLRGDRSQEQPSGNLRQRDSRLGTLVNSSPVFMGPPTVLAFNYPGHRAFVQANGQRPPVVFAGSNGGMLHVFDASRSTGAGQELLAYVPQGVYNKLRSYTLPDYEHQYMVDGTPLVGDADLGNGWRSVLIGTLGLGGRGYFVLDVTNTQALSTATPSDVVLLDRTAPGASATENHIGHIASPPAQDDTNESRSAQIVRLNNGRWAVVLGNGVNSVSGQAVLLIQYLDQDRALTAIPASAETGNALGTPRLLDLDGNGTADLVYAGDLRGNLWSFNLSDSNPANWSVRFAGQPLFVARSASNAVQPITTAPYALRVPGSQAVQVAFGTGRLMDTSDASNTSGQSLYSVRDTLSFARNSSGQLVLSDGSRISDGRTSLVAQTVTSVAGNFSSTSSNPVDYRSRRGWFMDLGIAGERQVSNTEIFQDSVVRFRTTVPSAQTGGESCNISSAQGRFFSTFLDIFGGTPAKTSVFGLGSSAVSRIEQTGPVEFALTGTTGKTLVQCTDLSCGSAEGGSGGSTIALRKTAPQAAVVDWRRLQ